jgi:hypothetical protein
MCLAGAELFQEDGRPNILAGFTKLIDAFRSFAFTPKTQMFGNKQLVIKAALYMMTYLQVGHACWEQLHHADDLGVLYMTSIFLHILHSLLIG